MTRPSARIVLALSLVIPTLRPGGDAGTGQAPTHSPNVATFLGTEYAFEGPARIPAGLTSLRLANRGKEVHWMETFKLEPGHTASEFFAWLTHEHSPALAPSWARATGGPSWTEPGDSSNQTSFLEPGHYVLVCRFPASDGVEHVRKGMFRELEVFATGREPGGPPRFDVQVAISDSSVMLSSSIAAGTRTVLVTNSGSVPHELSLFQLAPGKTIRDYEAWSGLKRPWPGRARGGVTFFQPGGRVWFTSTFRPGTYILGNEVGRRVVVSVAVR